MNNENKPSVIAELTAALASMAERAAAAEAEAEQYKKSSGERKPKALRARHGVSLTTAVPTGPAEKSQKKRPSSTGSPHWAKARSRRSSRESTLLSADMKTAPVFSLESSRNTSRQSRTRQPRQNTATAFSPALW